MRGGRITKAVPTMAGLGLLLGLVTQADTAAALTRIRRFSGAHIESGPMCSVDFGTITDSVAYQGGPVISNVQAVPVFWTSAIDPTVASWAQGYLGTLVDSAYMDLLTQYSTAGQAGGTGQTIGHGTVVAPVTITPLEATGAKVTDKEIGLELQAQITAGTLPAPTVDADGNTNTVYVLYFPQSITISYGGGTSCNDWCGYHGAYGGTAGNPSFAYAVIPDMGTGSECATGCSDECTTGDTAIMLATVSHELAESVTDPADAPAWVNPDQSSSNYEIGDICDGVTSTQIDTGLVPGTSIEAQYLWSQRDGQCLLANPAGDGVDAGSSSGGVDGGSSSGGKDAGGSSGGVDGSASGSGGSSGSSGGASSGSSGGASSSGSGGSSGSSSGGTRIDAGAVASGDGGEGNGDAPGGGGGCGCSAVGSIPVTGAGTMAVLVGALGVGWRRRRRRSG